MTRVSLAVIGGGINGQLFKFAVPEAVIFDWKPNPPAKLTRQFGANYLWEPIPDIPCRSFEVITAIDGDIIPTLEKVIRYKEKIGKPGDTADWQRQFQPRMRGYEFESFPPTSILYGHRIVQIDRAARTITFDKQGEVQYDLLISTIPLYSLLSLLGMPEPAGRLRYRPIFTKKTARPPDAPYPEDVMYVNYLSNPDLPPYRYCDRFGERHYESLVPFDSPGYTHRLTPGKIYMHPGVPGVLELLAGYGIFTFGRYGSWEPDELIHETWARITEWKEQVW